MKPIQPTNIKGTTIFVIPYSPKSTDSGLILPNQTGDVSEKSAREITPWVEITRVGEEVENYEAGDVVMVSPMILKRQGEPFDFGLEDDDGNKLWEIRLDVSNILADAHFTSDFEA